MSHFQEKTITELIAEKAILAIQDGNHGEKHPKSTDYVEEGIHFVMANDLNSGAVDLKGCSKIPESLASKLRIGFSVEGDVLLTHKGTIGNVAIVGSIAPYIMLTPQVTYYRTDNAKLSNKYLAYAFREPNFQKRMKSLAQQSTRPYIGITAQRNLKILWTDRETQESITEIISKYDDLIENNKRRIELLEESARQLYKEWFVRFRFPGHEHVKIIDGVPEGWETLELQDVCERITDGAHHSPKGVDDGLPMASVKDMHSWGIDLKTCRKISRDDFEKLEKGDCRPKQGDVLIAKDGSYLKHVFVAEDNALYVLLSSIAILRPNERIKSNQLAMFLGLSQTKKRLTGYVSGVALPRIILKEFRKFTFLCPPIKLQEMWADGYDCIFDLCRNLIKENEKLAEARDLLIPKLMSGEIAV